MAAAPKAASAKAGAPKAVAPKAAAPPPVPEPPAEAETQEHKKRRRPKGNKGNSTAQQDQALEKLKNEKIMPFHVAYRTKEAPSGHGYCGDFLPSF